MCWDNSSRVSPSPSSVAPANVDVSQLLPLMPAYHLSEAADRQNCPWPEPHSSQFHAGLLGPLLKAPLSQQQATPQAPSFSHFFTLKQSLQAPFLHSQRAPVVRASLPVDVRTQEPSPKRLALDLNCAAEDAEENIELDDVTDEVPDECLAQILDCLEDVKDRMACALVCRRWLHVLSLSKKQRKAQPEVAQVSTAVVAGASSKSVSVADATDVVSGLSRTLEGRSACDARLMAMAIALSDKGGVEKLVVRGNRRTRSADVCRSVGSPPLTASGFQAIAQASPNLRAVVIWDCDWLDDETVTVVARNCRKLEKLDIMNCPRLSDRSLSTLSRLCPHLSVLSLASCRMVTDQGLQVLAKGCHALTSLSLTSCPHVMGKGIAVLAASCKRLSALKLAGGLGLTDEGFRLLGESATGLSRLRLCQLRRLSEDGFKSLGETEGFQRLCSLSVAACDGLTSAALEVIGRGCVGLKSIALTSCANVSDVGLLALLQHAQALESLSLQMLPAISNEAAKFSLEYGKLLKSLAISNCPGVRDSVPEVADWAIRCPELSILKVTNCTAVGDGSLTSMGKAGATLASLDLCGLPLAGDKGVLAFLESSTKKLSSIDLSGCTQVTDKAVSQIAERCGENMRSLCLDGCARVTDKGLRAIARECTAIEDLDLSKCDITDRGLKFLLTAAGHSLVNLSLAGCVRITDRSVEEIMDACQCLSGLNLKNCSGLTKRAVDRLKQQAVNLFGPTCLFIDP